MIISLVHLSRSSSLLPLLPSARNPRLLPPYTRSHKLLPLTFTFDRRDSAISKRIKSPLPHTTPTTPVHTLRGTPDLHLHKAVLIMAARMEVGVCLIPVWTPPVCTVLVQNTTRLAVASLSMLVVSAEMLLIECI